MKTLILIPIKFLYLIVENCKAVPVPKPVPNPLILEESFFIRGISVISYQFQLMEYRLFPSGICHAYMKFCILITLMVCIPIICMRLVLYILKIFVSICV